MVGKQVGSVQGFLYVEDLRKLVGAGLHLYPNIVNLHQDLEAGRIDAAVDGYSTGVVAQQTGKLQGVQIKVPPVRSADAFDGSGQSNFPYQDQYGARYRARRGHRRVAGGWLDSGHP